MALVMVTPPEAVPVSLQEMKAQVNYFDPDQDAIIVGYIRAAVDYIEQTSGLRLIDQTWAYSTDGWSSWNGYIRLPIAPVQSITEITYLDTTGAPTVLPPGNYAFRGERITLSPGATWPAALIGLDIVTITFLVGYGPDHNYVPESLRQAIQMLAGYWFAQREAASSGPDALVANVPFGVTEILDGYGLRAV
jgi:uncharacterized phiE125 gp8 family phage protein